MDLGRSVYNPRAEERDTVPGDSIMDGVNGNDRLYGDEDEVQMSGGFMRKFGKKSMFAQLIAPGMPIPLDGLGQDEDEGQLSGGFMRKFGKKSMFAQLIAPGMPIPLDGLGQEEAEELGRLVRLGQDDEELSGGEDAEELAGVGIGALSADEFKTRVNALVGRFNDVKTEAAKLPPVKATALEKVFRQGRVNDVVDRLARSAAEGKPAEGLLMVGERRVSAAEAILANKKADTVERPFDVELLTGREFFKTRMREMRQQARAARDTAKRTNTPSYYGHQGTTFQQQTPVSRGPGRGAGWGRGWGPGRQARTLPYPGRMQEMAGLGDNVFNYLFRSTPMAIGEYNAKVAALAQSWAGTKARAGALGFQQGEALNQSAMKMTLSKYKTIDEALTQLQWDVVHHPTIQDTDTIKELDSRLPVLANLVSSMAASAPVQTQDGENARAVEYLKGEVDRQLAEKKALLASQGIFGVPWNTLAIGGGVVAAIGVGAWLFSGGKSR